MINTEHACLGRLVRHEYGDVSRPPLLTSVINTLFGTTYLLKVLTMLLPGQAAFVFGSAFHNIDCRIKPDLQLGIIIHLGPVGVPLIGLTFNILTLTTTGVLLFIFDNGDGIGYTKQ